MYTCKICGKDFEKRHSLAAHVSNHTHQHYKASRVEVIKQCLHCGKSFTILKKPGAQGKLNRKREKQYCSTACSNVARTKTRPTYSCLCCGKQINHEGCCSRKCRSKYNYETKINLILESNSFSGIVEKPDTVRKYLVLYHGHKCQICGINTWNNKEVPLVMDHINGNSDDWSFSNLRLICRNCDGQLPTFAGRNIGNLKTQSKRMKYQSHYRDKIQNIAE